MQIPFSTALLCNQSVKVRLLVPTKIFLSGWVPLPLLPNCLGQTLSSARTRDCSNLYFGLTKLSWFWCNDRCRTSWKAHIRHPMQNHYRSDDRFFCFANHVPSAELSRSWAYPWQWSRPFVFISAPAANACSFPVRTMTRTFSFLSRVWALPKARA